VRLESGLYPGAGLNGSNGSSAAVRATLSPIAYELATIGQEQTVDIGT
jgi:hypothetical protein